MHADIHPTRYWDSVMHTIIVPFLIRYVQQTRDNTTYNDTAPVITHRMLVIESLPRSLPFLQGMVTFTYTKIITMIKQKWKVPDV